ncbi:MAG: MlaD family protein [Pseudomonadota bacterium]|nr:MlaD family protein [Pseudomonadota bacterium]
MNEPIIKHQRFSALWIFPVIALLAGLWLAFQHIASQGPEIQIRFNSAQGIEEGKTKLRYKSLDIGVVKSIELAEDLSHVVLHVQTTRNAKPLISEDASFWVVRPQISASGIRGLNTLITGSYIAVNPGDGNNEATQFTGLEETPVIEPSVAGTRIKLAAQTAKGINVGTPFVYRGIDVGQIENIEFKEPFRNVNLSAFIRSPYDALINNNTKFWNIGGVEVEMGATGFSFEMNSLETLIIGGITFETPQSFLDESAEISANKVFRLYDSRKDINRTNYQQKEYYVLYFDQSVSGLGSGSPVQYNGIQLGSVLEVRLVYDKTKQQALIPILIEIEPERVTYINSDQDNEFNIIEQLVSQGLVAKIETGNFLTGSKFISLGMGKKPTAGLTEDQYSRHLVMPTQSGSLNELTANINGLLEKVNQLPLERFMELTNDTVENLRGITGTEGMQEIGNSLNASLQELKDTLATITSVGQKADTVLGELADNMEGATKDLNTVIKGMGPDSPMYYQMTEMLEQLKESGKAIEKLTDHLREQPDSLIFGNDYD